ncbi:hypothetical protein V8E53_007958 [Lactarius tabidus]
MLGVSKLGVLTHPSQVIRSRIQVDSALSCLHHRTIASTIARIKSHIRSTHKGVAGFFRGLSTNLVRVFPGTCGTFVVYENIAWLLKRAAVRCEVRGEGSQWCIYGGIMAYNAPLGVWGT